MARRRNINGICAGLLICMAALVACSGGNSVPTAPPQMASPGNGTQAGVTIALAQSGTTALPSANGISSSIELSKNSAPVGTTLSVNTSVTAPSGMATIPSGNAKPFEYFTFVTSSDVTFSAFPKITLTLKSAPQSQGSFYVWLYAVGATTWTDLGSVTVNGSTLSFGGGAQTLTLKRGLVYVAVPFTAKTGASCPTPPPTPSPGPCMTPPVATPGPTPSSTRIYIANSCTLGAVIVAYDESGNVIPLAGTFSQLVAGGAAMAFDPFNQHIYIRGAGLLHMSALQVYDKDGMPVFTSGSFPAKEGATGVAFSTATRRLYVTFSSTIGVYDENGNAVSTTGAFPNLNGPSGITFDSFNDRLYVANSSASSVNVYDEDGNQIQTSGTFPFLQFPIGIAFDSSNRHIYVSDGNSTHAFDEDGNVVSGGGSIPTGNGLSTLAFDPTNNHLYAAIQQSTSNMQGGIAIFDQNGNIVTPSGTFPFLWQPAGIVAVP